MSKYNFRLADGFGYLTLPLGVHPGQSRRGDPMPISGGRNEQTGTFYRFWTEAGKMDAGFGVYMGCCACWIGEMGQDRVQWLLGNLDSFDDAKQPGVRYACEEYLRDQSMQQSPVRPPTGMEGLGQPFILNQADFTATGTFTATTTPQTTWTRTVPITHTHATMGNPFAAGHVTINTGDLDREQVETVAELVADHTRARLRERPFFEQLMPAQMVQPIPRPNPARWVITENGPINNPATTLPVEDREDDDVTMYYANTQMQVRTDPAIADNRLYHITDQDIRNLAGLAPTTLNNGPT